MHKKTYTIIKNLGFGDEVIKNFKKEPGLDKNLLAELKKLGIPDAALKQIKSLENKTSEKPNLTNKELIRILLKRCKRSLDAFASRKHLAKIIFAKNNWTIYSDMYSKEIEKLHIVCKPYFDKLAECGINVILLFEGTDSWKIVVDKKTDLPGE